MNTKSRMLSSAVPVRTATDIAFVGRSALTRATIGLGLLRLASAGGPALSDEVKAAIEPVMTAFEEFKKVNDERIKAEAKGAVDVLVTDKLTKIEATLANLEGVGQKLALFDKQQKALEEQSGAMNALIAKIEAKVGRQGFGGGTAIERQAELKKLVNEWASAVLYANTMGVANLNELQRKALDAVREQYKVLRISDDTGGGYLAPPEFVQVIIQAVVLISNARAIVNVRQTANKSVRMPKRTGVFAAQRVTEQGTRTETTGLKFGLEEVTAPEMYAIIDVSNEDLEDSAFDLEAYIRDNASEQFAVKEGQEFCTGTGIGEMEGILTNTAISGDVSGNAATISADGVLSVKYNLKSAYSRNASYILNRKTIGSVRKLKDGVGNYLWMPGIQNSAPNTIDGDPYYEMPDMPNEGASVYPIAYGDWKRAYTIVDRIAMTFLRDPYTQGASGNVRMWFRRRVGGQVVLAEAIRKLQCHT